MTKCYDDHEGKYEDIVKRMKAYIERTLPVLQQHQNLCRLTLAASLYLEGTKLLKEEI